MKSILIDGSIPAWPSYLRELLRYRQVAMVLIKRDLIIRFRHTVFGVAWLLFKPLMLMVVISLAFGFISRTETSTSAPYPLVVLCAVVPWYFFSNAVPDGMHSIVGHLNIIQKIYFPRLLIPLVAVLINVVEFLAAWLLFVLACLWYAFVPGWQLSTFPLFAILLIALCLGVVLWLSILQTRFRDVGNLIPFLITLAFFVSPIGYTLDAVPEAWRSLYVLNPLVGIVEGFRWSLLGATYTLHLGAVAWSAVTSMVIFLTGIWNFRRTEPYIAELA